MPNQFIERGFGEMTTKTSKTGVKLQLSGKDGNIFFILGRASAALKTAKMHEQYWDEFSEKVKSSENYDAALQVCMEYFDVR